MTVYSNIINPLDWQTILVGYLSGSYEIFTFLMFIFLGILASKWKISGIVFIALLLLFPIMVVFYEPVIVIGVLILGLVGSFVLGRAYNQ